MSKKKRYFIYINSFLIFIIIFIGGYFLKNNFFEVLIVSSISIAIYLLVSNSLVDDMLKVENNLQEKIQKSMHELNTPVSTIQINTQMLKTKLKDEKNILRLKRIEKASQELLDLYEDMEYFIKEKIDRVDIKEFNLKDAINKSVNKFNELKKDIKIYIDIEQNKTIKCDQIGFIRTIDNLLQNAIKHNPKLTKIEVYEKDQKLYIKDNGQGIDSDAIYNVFNKYFQDHKAKGFGLGLSIVKEYCDKNNIDIKIDTNQNGTTFKLNLRKIVTTY